MQTIVLRRLPSGMLDLGSLDAFSPGGQHLASAGADNTIRLWDLETGALLVTLAPAPKG